MDSTSTPDAIASPAIVARAEAGMARACLRRHNSYAPGPGGCAKPNTPAFCPEPFFQTRVLRLTPEASHATWLERDRDPESAGAGGVSHGLVVAAPASGTDGPRHRLRQGPHAHAGRTPRVAHGQADRTREVRDARASARCRRPQAHARPGCTHDLVSCLAHPCVKVCRGRP